MEKFQNRVLVLGYYQMDSRCLEFAYIANCVYSTKHDCYSYTYSKQYDIEESQIDFYKRFFKVQYVNVH